MSQARNAVKAARDNAGKRGDKLESLKSKSAELSSVVSENDRLRADFIAKTTGRKPGKSDSSSSERTKRSSESTSSNSSNSDAPPRPKTKPRAKIRVNDQTLKSLGGKKTALDELKAQYEESGNILHFNQWRDTVTAFGVDKPRGPNNKLLPNDSEEVAQHNKIYNDHLTALRKYAQPAAPTGSSDKQIREQLFQGASETDKLARAQKKVAEANEAARQNIDARLESSASVDLAELVDKTAVLDQFAHRFDKKGPEKKPWSFRSIFCCCSDDEKESNASSNNEISNTPYKRME